MEYEDCRIAELINHAAREDAEAQGFSSKNCGVMSAI
jgi:hypothetical protein